MFKIMLVYQTDDFTLLQIEKKNVIGKFKHTHTHTHALTESKSFRVED